MGTHDEIIKQFREQQEKYVYYLIALSVAAIGFAIVNTSEKPFELIQIPLGLSVISWGISIYCGFEFLKYMIGSLLVNIELINSKRANPQKANSIENSLSELSNKTKSLLKKQHYFFYAGIILYLIWHLLEMYHNTIT